MISGISVTPSWRRSPSSRVRCRSTSRGLEAARDIRRRLFRSVDDLKPTLRGASRRPKSVENEPAGGVVPLLVPEPGGPAGPSRPWDTCVFKYVFRLHSSFSNSVSSHMDPSRGSSSEERAPEVRQTARNVVGAKPRGSIPSRSTTFPPASRRGSRSSFPRVAERDAVTGDVRPPLDVLRRRRPALTSEEVRVLRVTSRAERLAPSRRGGRSWSPPRWSYGGPYARS